MNRQFLFTRIGYASTGDTQQELAAVSDGSGQPQARVSDDLSAFLDGLTTAWQNVDRPPQGRRKAATKHWWRTRIDPFAYTWPMVEDWLRAEPEITAKALMQRLRRQFPDSLSHWRSTAYAATPRATVAQ